MSKPLYRCWTKATDRETGEPRRSLNWVASRRAWFSIFEDRLECGDWCIPFESVRKAIAYRTRSMFIPCTVLRIETAEKTFQFGFNPWARPVEKLPFHILEEAVRLQHSAFSIIVRVVLLLYIVYLVWDWIR